MSRRKRNQSGEESQVSENQEYKKESEMTDLERANAEFLLRSKREKEAKKNAETVLFECFYLVQGANHKKIVKLSLNGAGNKYRQYVGRLDKVDSAKLKEWKEKGVFYEHEKLIPQEKLKVS